MLYHKDIFLPAIAANLYGRKYRLQYSGHAKQACLNDRYGLIDKPPFNITITKDNLIEIELNENKLINKVVVRVPYDERFDVAVAIIPDFDIATVKTIWKNDKHFTLNRAAYKNS